MSSIKWFIYSSICAACLAAGWTFITISRLLGHNITGGMFLMIGICIATFVCCKDHTYE